MRSLSSVLTRLFAVGGAALLISAGAAARAEVVRIPAAGLPAMTVDLPAGWNAARDKDGNVTVTHPGAAVVLVLSMGRGATPSDTLDTIANAFFKGFDQVAGITRDPVSRTEPAFIADARGKAYVFQAHYSGVTLQCRMIVTQLSDGAFAIETLEWAPANISAGQLEELQALGGQVRLMRGP